MARVLHRAAAMFGSIALVAIGLVVAPTGAGASGGEQGVLRIHGPGSTFAGSFAFVTQVVSAPGATGTFAVQVKNNGPTTAQFNFRVASTGQLCGGACTAPSDTVSAGSVVVTSLAHGPNGYYTAPIAPGKTAALTFKVVTPKAPNSLPGDTFGYQIDLLDTAGNPLDFAYVHVSNKVAAGTLGADQYVSASGTAATTTLPSGLMSVTAPAFAVNGIATFTIKLKNDSAVAEPIHFSIGSLGACSSFFKGKVVVGSTDVTALVAADNYATPTLAHGASVTLKLTVQHLSGAAACLSSIGQGYVVANGTAYNSNSATSINYVMAPVATN